MKKTQLNLDLIPHRVENELIHQRAVDGYVNATAICKAAGKNFYDYRRIGATDEFLTELSNELGIPREKLVISISGGRAELQGTWVHPDVAINLGQWCSPKFAVAVAKWVREWASGISAAGLPYHIQRYMANRKEIPSTHFSMLNEMVFALIAPMEEAGYTLPDEMLPDISTGRMFCKWLRDEKGIDTDSLPVYKHIYADGRIVYPKLYPIEVLADFRRYFHNVWLPQRAESYFRERDSQAVVYLTKILPGTSKPTLGD